MHHSQLAAQFLIDTYRFNQEDKNRLTHIFEAYKNPEKTQTQIPDQRTAAAYMIARGLSISGVMQHIFEQEPAFFFKNKKCYRFWRRARHIFMVPVRSHSRCTLFEYRHE